LCGHPLGLVRPVGHQLRHVSEGAHDWPFTRLWLAIEDVCRQFFDLLEKLLNVVFNYLDALFGRHVLSVAGHFEALRAII
jgi:hypothetical protein